MHAVLGPVSTNSLPIVFIQKRATNLIQDNIFLPLRHHTLITENNFPRIEEDLIMSLVPRNRLFDLESFFEPSFLSPLWQTRAESTDMTAFSPRVDINEKKDTYEITAELPGVKKEDIGVKLENGVLSIEAETKQESKEEEGGKVIRQERRYGKFYRSFDLGAQVQESDVRAEFKDGVLKIVAPHAREQKIETKKISIS